MFRHLWYLSPIIVLPIDIPNIEAGEFTCLNVIEARGIDSDILPRLREIEFVKHMHAAGLAEKVVNGRRITDVVCQDIIAGGLGKQSKLFGLESYPPVSKFPTDGAIAFECTL